MDENMKIELKPQFDYESECKSVELEIINPKNLVDARLDQIDNQIADLDISIDKLTNHADKLDYAVSVASGIIAGIIDILFVGKFDLQEGRDWSSEKINDFVTTVAKKQGYEGDDLQGAIRHLEKFGAPSDSVYNDFGGGLQHHLRDFAHHASPVGLVFSMLTQFTQKAYGTNTAGAFIVVPIDKTTLSAILFQPKSLSVWCIGSYIWQVTWLVQVVHQVQEQEFPDLFYPLLSCYLLHQFSTIKIKSMN